MVFRGKSRICFIGPVPPPYGGMAIQMKTMVENLKRDGVDTVFVKANQDIPSFIKKVKGLRTIVNSAFYLLNIFRKIPSSEVVYILCASNFYFFSIVVPAILVSKIFRKRVFLNYRGGGPQTFFKRYGYILRFIMKHTKVTVPSGYLKGVIKEYLDIESLIVPNFSYLDEFKYRFRSNFSPRILCSRNFDKIYNIPCIIRCYRLIKDKYPQATLGLVGDGIERENIEKLVSDLGLERGVRFYGKVAHHKLPEIYDSYDIFLNASEVDNFPASIIEAMASGLAVVSTNVGGIPYIVHDGKTGFLVDRGDYVSMAKKAMSIIENPLLISEMTKKARQETEKYRWENVKKVFLDTVFGEINGKL